MNNSSYTTLVMKFAILLLACLASNFKMIEMSYQSGRNPWNKRVTDLTLNDLIDNSADILKLLNDRGVNIPYVQYGRRGYRGYNYGNRDETTNGNRQTEQKNNPNKNQNPKKNPKTTGSNTGRNPSSQKGNQNKRPTTQPPPSSTYEDDDSDSNEFANEKYRQMLENIKNNKKNR